MTPLRRQLPAYSPLGLTGVAAAWRTLLLGDAVPREAVAGALRNAYGAAEALLVGSGTMALRLALEGVRGDFPGRPVALPAYSCFDLATAADGAGVDVLLYDIDPDTLGPDADSLRRQLARGPAAVVAAHLFGYPVDMALVTRMAHDAGAVVIEDAAQAAGGLLGGVRLGSFGDLTVLSFGRGKGTTAGAGGALLARGERGCQVVRRAAARYVEVPRGAREAVLLSAQWVLGRPALYGLPASIPFLRLGETVYHSPREPQAMSAAAIGALSVALRAGDIEVAHRGAVAGRLLASLRASTRARPPKHLAGATPGFLRLPVQVSDGPVQTLVERLGSHGVARAYPKTLVDLRPFRDRVRNVADPLPGADALSRQLATFPTHRLVTERDLEAIEYWLA